MDLITKKRHDEGMDDYTNDLTKEMDKHLIGNYPDYFNTYIYGNKPNHYLWYSFRFPGATRGGIKVNEDNVIEKIEFFKDIASCYEDSVYEAVNKFIGSKIIFG